MPFQLRFERKALRQIHLATNKCRPLSHPDYVTSKHLPRLGGWNRLKPVLQPANERRAQKPWTPHKNSSPLALFAF
jgi:hypothetical protein